MVHGRDAERGERVNLLGDLHAPQLGGERGAGAAGNDDARHQRSHLAQHAEPDQVRGVVARAEPLEHDDAEEGDDDADEQRDERHDGECARAVGLHDDPELAPAHAHASEQHLGAALRHLSRKRERGHPRVPGGDAGEPNPCRERKRRGLGVHGALRHGAGEREKAGDPGGEALGRERELMRLAILLSLPKEDQEAAVPAVQRGGVHGDDARGASTRGASAARVGGERRLQQRREARGGALYLPRARQRHHQGVPLARDLREGRHRLRRHRRRAACPDVSNCRLRSAPMHPPPNRRRFATRVGATDGTTEGCAEASAEAIA